MPAFDEGGACQDRIESGFRGECDEFVSIPDVSPFCEVCFEESLRELRSHPGVLGVLEKLEREARVRRSGGVGLVGKPFCGSELTQLPEHLFALLHGESVTLSAERFGIDVDGRVGLK